MEGKCALGCRASHSNIGIKNQVVVMNLNELEKLGCVESKQKGHYSITVSGKEALGFPILTPELAQRILYPRKKEEAFHFFTGIGNYTGVFACSLQEFFEKNKRLMNNRSDFTF